jgi:hypothetical protein
MPEPGDVPLTFHPSFNELIDSFRTMIAALAWLRATPEEAQTHFAPWHYVVTFDCTVSDKSIKVDKSAFVAFQKDAAVAGTPLFASTLANLYRVVTVSVKDIMEEHPDFSTVRNDELFRFLRHIRNAAAHENHFYFGIGRQRDRTLAGLPARWRNKTIDAVVEGKQLFHEFLGAGDLLFLLSDVSALARPTAATGTA